jgi:hypothetical protein
MNEGGNVKNNVMTTFVRGRAIRPAGSAVAAAARGMGALQLELRAVSVKADAGRSWKQDGPELWPSQDEPQDELPR